MPSLFGGLADRVTQLWVRVTGRRITLPLAPWLDGPIGKPTGIGPRYFEELAAAEALTVDVGPGHRGLLVSFDHLAGPGFDPTKLHPRVRRFYENTSEYDMNAWAEWCGAFRPFGWLISRLFSQRLQQLNLPLSALDTSRGMLARVLHLKDSRSGALRRVGWMRELVGTGKVVYAGQYGVAIPPGLGRPAIQVVFPLPNGNAIILLRPEVGDGGRLAVWSQGARFGDAGFYFTVHAKDGRIWARYLRSMQEVIEIYPGTADDLRADHTLWLWGMRFLRIHYHLTPKRQSAAA